ncbi:hypothetical protein ACFQX6_58500 [Streptosporangium lutulentum]
MLASACGLLPLPHVSAAIGASRSSPDAPVPPGFDLEMTGTSTESVQGSDGSFRQFTVIMDMKSKSREPVTIVGIGRSGPGLTLLSPEKQDAQVLHPDRSLGFSLKYKIVDCAAVPRGDWPIPVRVEVSGVQKTVYAPFRRSIRVARGGRPARPGRPFCRQRCALVPLSAFWAI